MWKLAVRVQKSQLSSSKKGKLLVQKYLPSCPKSTSKIKYLVSTKVTTQQLLDLRPSTVNSEAKRIS